MGQTPYHNKWEPHSKNGGSTKIKLGQPTHNDRQAITATRGTCQAIWGLNQNKVRATQTQNGGTRLQKVWGAQPK